ncbi:MAG TPA: hypothetical protein VLN47_06960 [Clostridiaceae bacterium]|nr:hypothetical protein [Clostridiaceae bacterium]
MGRSSAPRAGRTFLGECPPLPEDESVFESFIRGIDLDRKEKVFKVYQEIFQKSDRDIILTVEEFIRSDLACPKWLRIEISTGIP